MRELYPDINFNGKLTIQNILKLVRFYQFYVYYGTELTLWYENPPYKGTTLQEYLYANRLKYLNKKPNELTNKQILIGFKISGIYRGYTVYDPILMKEVIDKYKIKSVYDPCAGWGERMLYCYSQNIPYTGVDINGELEEGYNNMMCDFDMIHQEFIVGDSSKIKAVDGFDAVMTCPPYGDIEYYSDKGAENLDYDDFLKWWNKVIENSVTSSTRYFCFQINQKYRNDMSDLILKHGFKLIDETYRYKRSSHFTRNKNGVDKKKEYEVMLVFEKI